MMKRLLAIMVMTALACAAAPIAKASLAEDFSITVKQEVVEGFELTYVEVDGIADEAIGRSINERLKEFCLTRYADAGSDNTLSNESVIYASGGERYVSLRLVQKYTGVEPRVSMAAMVFDLTTGDPAGPITSFILLDEELRQMIIDGVFVMTHPDTPVEGAAERFAQEFVNNYDPDKYGESFYLTDTTFGLILNGQADEEGGYWTFEAPYDSVAHLLSQELLEALGK